MRRTPILETIYPSRFGAIEALVDSRGADATERLQAAAENVRASAAKLAHAPAAAAWTAFGEAVAIASLLVQWEAAVLAAEADADRFLRAARKRRQRLAANGEPAQPYATTLAAIDLVADDIDVDALCRAVAAVPMRVAVEAHFEYQRPAWAGAQPRDRQAEIAVAFLEFMIDGKPAAALAQLSPGVTHDLDLIIRVSRWPAGAERLHLRAVSIDPKSSYDLPTFTFERPSGKPPFNFRQNGRMRVLAPQALSARPFEFMYSAEFEPSGGTGFAISGHRVLRFDCSADGQPLTGDRAVDDRLRQLRDELRHTRAVPEADLQSVMTLLVSVGQLASQAVADALFPGAMSEAVFETAVREFLRRSPAIGGRLEQQAQAGGGRTDLSFEQIRIELKASPAALAGPGDCERFAEQAASYAVASGKRVALLLVLDASSKERPPFPVEDSFRLFEVPTATTPVYVIACVVQGNLAKPHTLSRGKP